MHIVMMRVRESIMQWSRLLKAVGIVTLFFVTIALMALALVGNIYARIALFVLIFLGMIFAFYEMLE